VSDASAIVEITRERSVANSARGYAVLLDGERIDRIGNGQTRRYAVAPGRHEIRIGLDFYRSRPLALDLGPGETICLECGAAVPQTLGESLSAGGLKRTFGTLLLNPADYLFIGIASQHPAAPRTGAGAPVDPAFAVRDPEGPARRPATPGKGPGPTPSIFLSYRRADTRLVTGRIRDALAHRFGAEAIFRDVDSIPLGTRFRDKISETIARAGCVLAVIGPDWVDARDEDGNRRLDDPEDYVRFEIESTLAQGHPLLPVLVENAPMPKASRLPASLRPLTAINGVIIPQEPYFEVGIERMIATLETLMQRPAPDGAESPAARTPPATPASPRRAGGRYCTGCGGPVGQTQRFCTRCGKPV